MQSVRFLVGVALVSTLLAACGGGSVGAGGDGGGGGGGPPPDPTGTRYYNLKSDGSRQSRIDLTNGWIGDVGFWWLEADAPNLWGRMGDYAGQPYTQILDMGPVDGLADVRDAPIDGYGWSAALFFGHAYVIRWGDPQSPGYFRYARVYIADITASSVLIAWTVQLDGSTQFPP